MRNVACSLFCLIISSCGGGGDVESPYEFSAVIGPEGGTLDGPDGSGLVVPAGAVTADIEFFVEVAEEDALAGLTAFMPIGPAYDFGPNGEVFKKMVTIRVPFEPARIPVGNTLDEVVVYISGSEGNWQPLATNLPATGDDVANAATLHFCLAAVGLEN